MINDERIQKQGLHALYLRRGYGEYCPYTRDDFNNDGINDVLLRTKKGVYLLTIGGYPVNHPPIAFFTYSPLNATVNQMITFNASVSHDLDGSITNYEWNFGDENVTNTAEKTITHSYASAGDYTVSLTVTDDKGAKNTTTKIITVLPLAHIPHIYI